MDIWHFIVISYFHVCICHTSLEFMKRIKCDERRMKTNETRRDIRKAETKNEKSKFLRFLLLNVLKRTLQRCKPLNLGRKESKEVSQRISQAFWSENSVLSCCCRICTVDVRIARLFSIQVKRAPSIQPHSTLTHTHIRTDWYTPCKKRGYVLRTNVCNKIAA